MKRKNVIMPKLKVGLLILFLLVGSLLIAGQQFTAKAALRTVYCDTVTEIQNALKNAQPGDEIVIASGTYTGTTSNSGSSEAVFYSNKNGTLNNHIIVRSENPTNPAILKHSKIDDKYVFYLLGDYWEVRDIKFTTAKKGIMIDNGNYNLFYNIEVYNIGEEGIHFRDGSSHNTVENSYIHDVGKGNPDYGEGIYVGSDVGKWDQFNMYCDSNVIRNNTIGPNCTAESIDIKEGTTGTIVEGNIMNGTGISGANYADSFMDVKGNNCIIRNNKIYRNSNNIIVDAFQVHDRVEGWGYNNAFNNNEFHMDIAAPYIVNVYGGSATASNNIRYPEGNMYKGDVTVDGSSPAPSVNPTPTPTATKTPTPSPTTSPVGGTNLALNRPVTFSNQQTGNEADHINDGNTSNRWSGSPYPAWVRIDLGASYSINKTELVPYSNRAYQYKVEVSTDGTNFSQVVNRTSNTTGGSLLTDTFTAVNARYVRLTITGCYNYTGGWASINEFRVFGGGSQSPAPSASVVPTATPTPTASVVPTPMPTVSPVADQKLSLTVAGNSADDGNVAQNVLDGNLNTRFSSNGDGAYITLGTGGTYTVSQVKIAWYNGATRQFYFEIFASTDNVNFTKIYPSSGNATSAGNTTNLETYDVADIQAKYIKVVGHENSYNTWFSPSEIQVWGRP